MERRLIMNWAMRAWRPCNRCCIAIVLHFGLDGVVDLASLMFDGGGQAERRRQSAMR